ncbi:transposable element Tc3 transposase [Trichonephila clavipes]|nr:transposable element Tc3 transposase [Trichonephila clavipes]
MYRVPPNAVYKLGGEVNNIPDDPPRSVAFAQGFVKQSAPDLHFSSSFLFCNEAISSRKGVLNAYNAGLNPHSTRPQQSYAANVGRILFSDEAYFWLNGYVNKQNCRIWSEANPQVYVRAPLHPEKLTVWCALWAGGIIGPYFFKNDEGNSVTELWFQQDGATCHTARATIDLLKDTFGDHLISRFGPVNWPTRSCDLTPLEYFPWGYLKSLVYVDKPQTLDHLEDNIRRVIADIRPEMLEKVLENWTTSEPAVAVICQKSY